MEDINWELEEGMDKEMIDRFSMLAQGKMLKNREKGRHGWWNPEICSKEYLSQLLHLHMMKGDPMDVALIAMMLVTRNEKIAL